MNIKEALPIITEILKKNKNIRCPEIEAEMLLAHTLGENKIFLLTNGDRALSDDCTKIVVSQANRRLANYPMAYITGRKEFYGLDFFVNENVLIPRPETELIVRLALDEADNYKDICFSDIGTGSGCIIISLAKFFKQKKACFAASDISDLAIKTAEKNSRFHMVSDKISFSNSDLASATLKTDQNKDIIIITANLPYLTPKQIAGSPTIQAEPVLALEAGDDGLLLYKRFFSQIKEYKNKTKITAICEFDHTQTNAIQDMANSILPDYNSTIHKDLSGFDRVIKIYRP
jgi:release factor glutamine methyltransferase